MNQNKAQSNQANSVSNNLFSDITEQERRDAIEKIIESSSPRKSYFMMMTVSAILCTLGIIGDNAAVIIGGMIIAPMLSPILSVAMGIGMADFKLIYRSLRVIFTSVAYVIVFSFATAFLLDRVEHDQMNKEMILRVGVSLESLLVALVAGMAASLSVIRTELHKYLAGTAIAVALIPPLSMSAIGLRMFDLEIFYQSFMQFFFSLCGIILSSLLVFALSRFYISRQKATQELQEEEKMLCNSKKIDE
ncbi:MAG: TIGR00341 family protein [Patescibacteria group bacterium]|nr:TIGR00341 family protein [Patescibacteria group bacterium]